LLLRRLCGLLCLLMRLLRLHLRLGLGLQQSWLQHLHLPCRCSGRHLMRQREIHSGVCAGRGDSHCTLWELWLWH